MIGLQEIVLILAVFLFIFGPEKMPEIARGIGSAIQEFKKASTNLPEREVLSLKDEMGKEREKIIINIARNLDINTEGTAMTQLLEEIERKMVKSE